MGAVVFAQGVIGIGAVVFATRDWETKTFSPIALVTTNSANTATISHLDIYPSG